MHDRLKDLREYLGIKGYVLVPVSKSRRKLSPTEYHFKNPYQYMLIGIYKDVEDNILQYMFDLGWEFVDYTIDQFTHKLAVVIKEKVIK